MTGALDATTRAVAWLVEGIERYLSIKGASEKAEFRRLKAICEISFIAALLPDAKGAEEFARAVASPLFDIAHGGRLLTAVWHQPQHANLYLPMLYALCCEGQLADEELEDLTRLLRRLVAIRKERQPFRTLDFLFSLYLLSGDEAHIASMRSAAAFGCLGPSADVLSYTDGDEYAVTHSVFYLTGFGRWAWPFGNTSRDHSCRLLQALSLDALSVENWALYSEYLAAEAMVDGKSQKIEQAPLVAAQDRDGGWPGPVDLGTTIRSEGFEEATGLTFYQKYHTTLVAWMALATDCSRHRLRTFSNFASDRPVDLGSKYTELAEDWVGLWKAFRSLLGDRTILEPAAALARQPQAVLPWLEWSYWRQRLDPGAQRPFALEPSLEAVIAEAATARQWRQLRCALLGCDIAALDHGLIAFLCDRIAADKSEAPSGLLAAAALDRLVSWALLHRHTAGHGPGAFSSLAETAERTLLLALRHRNIFAPGPLLAFAGELIDAGLWRQAQGFLKEGQSHSLPFGFISGATAPQQRRCFAAECYLPQADLWACLEGLQPNQR